MAASPTGELPASMAVLALLAQKRDTLAAVKIRLDREHPSAGWPANIVHTSVTSLARQGFVRVAEAGREPALDVLEATVEGREHFRHWRRTTATVLAMRDGLQAKLKYVEDEAELRTLVNDIREHERLWAREGNAARLRLRAAIQSGLLEPAGPGDWRARARRALMIDEANLWSTNARRLQRLREALEDPDGSGDELNGQARDG
jgi:hypothetical protein